MSLPRKYLAIVPSPNSLLFFFTTSAVLFSSAKSIANDPGIGWHLSTGDYIITNFSVPLLDPFLSIARPWISDQWGSDVILSTIYGIGGWPLLASTVGIVFIIAYFILLYRALLKEHSLPIPTLIATIAAAKAAQIHYIVRPVVFSFFMFVLFFSRTRSAFIFQQANNSLPRNCWITFPCLFVIWSNIHPSFLLGLAVLALWPISLILHSYLLPNENLENHTWKQVKDSSLLTILATLGTLLNPYGYRLHTSIVFLSSNQYFMNYHVEWLSPDFDKIEGKILEILLLSLVVMIYFSKQKLSRLSTFELISSVFLLHGGLQAIRITPYFLIAFAFPWSRILSNIITENSERFVVRKLPMLDRIERRASWYWMGVAVCLFMVLFLPQLNLKQWSQEPKFGPSPEKYPYVEVNYILNHTEEDSIVVAAPGSFGGFITHFSKGKLKPIIDDRNTLLGEDIYKKFHEAELESDKMKDFIKFFKTNYLILPKNHYLICALERSQWLTKAFSGPVGMVFKIDNAAG